MWDTNEHKNWVINGFRSISVAVGYCHLQEEGIDGNLLLIWFLKVHTM